MDENENDQSTKNKLFNVKEEDCILVEFINELHESNTSLQQVGYLCWLSDEDALNLDEIIRTKKQVTISWPNCDIKTPRYMKTTLRKASFKDYVVIVLAHGDWLTTKDKPKNLEQFGVLEPSRNERKNLKRKIDDNLHKSASNLSEAMSQIKYNRLNISDDDSVNSENLLDEIEKNVHENEHDDEDNNSESDDQVMKLLSSKDNEIQMKNQKIISLEKRISFVKQQFDAIKAKYELLETKQASLQLDLDLLRDKAISTADNDELKHLVHTITEDLVAIQNIVNYNVSKLADAGHLKDITNNETTVKDKSKMNVVQETTKKPKLSKDIEEHKKVDTKKKKSRIPLNLYPTDYEIKQSQLSNMDKSSISSYARDLVSVLFTEEELASHTVTGKQCNANKGLEVRPQLDIHRINAAKNECLKVFGKLKSFDALFNYGVKNKCGYHKQKLKGTLD